METVIARDLWQSIHDHLRDRIVAGELRPGTRLVETELARQFNTSRGPVRSALKELERDGLVVVNPRRGSFVLPMSGQDIDEIFSLFETLWPLAARRAVDRMSDADFEVLAQMLEEIDSSRADADAWTELNLRFHRTLFEFAGHTRLLKIWESLEAQSRVLASAITEADPGDMRSTINLEPAIYRALKKGDVETASRVVTRYLQQMRKSLKLGRG